MVCFWRFADARKHIAGRTERGCRSLAHNKLFVFDGQRLLFDGQFFLFNGQRLLFDGQFFLFDGQFFLFHE